MHYLHSFTQQITKSGKDLTPSEAFSVFYHNIFEYPLTFSDIVRWRPADFPKTTTEIDYKSGFYFVKGSEGLIYKRSIRKRFSQGKIDIAKKASDLISKIPSVKMVGLTGSLAMENASGTSDIDLLIVTKSGRLWLTRLIAYIILNLCGFTLRKPKSSKEKNKLCLNMWLDETDMIWDRKMRNIFTAHEILQTKPLFDRDNTYKLFLSENNWSLDFWPNAAEIKLKKANPPARKYTKPDLLEELAFKVQYFYMKPKITREVIKDTRAIFHPHDWSKKVLTKLSS